MHKLAIGGDTVRPEIPEIFTHCALLYRVSPHYVRLYVCATSKTVRSLTTNYANVLYIYSWGIT